MGYRGGKLKLILLIFGYIALALATDQNLTGTKLSEVTSANWFEWIGKNWLLAAVVPTVILGTTIWFWDRIKPVIKHTWLFIFDSIREINYRYIGLRKHVTVYKNGHGIILHDIELKIYKPNESFEKSIDISDGQTNCVFPPLNTMKQTRIEDRFTHFGFWCTSNPPGVISSVDEVLSKSNNKKKVIKFTFDPDKVKKLKNKPVKILYGFSIPKLHPIENGRYDASLGGQNPIISEFDVKYPMNYFTYVIGLEDGVNITSKEGKYYPRGEGNVGTDIAIQEKDDLFYNKYSMMIKNPKVGSLISARFRLS